MGYCYNARTKKICCDCCGQSGNARKRACPCGYCPATALCVECNKAVRNDGRWFKWHQDCKKNSDEFKARNNREKALKESGVHVRCSALAVGYLVHVLFENKHGEVIGKMMTHETYDAFPLLEPTTVEDYAKVGIVTDAPGEFQFGAREAETEKCVKFFSENEALFQNEMVDV